MGTRNTARSTFGSLWAGSRSVLRRTFRWSPRLESAPRNTDLDALRRRGEIGLAVERRENGATHEGGAAKPGENRAAEPLHGDAAPVDQTAAAAVDRQRRFVAELDGLGHESSTTGARPTLVQTDVPCTRFASAAPHLPVRRFGAASPLESACKQA